jgi:hypothetical protein
MRRTVSALSAGIRFRAMRAKRASSVSCRANFAESLMPNLGLLLIIKVNECSAYWPARGKIIIPLHFSSTFACGTDLSRYDAFEQLGGAGDPSGRRLQRWF